MSAATVNTPITFKFSGNTSIRSELSARQERELTDAVQDILELMGFGGEFTLTIATKIKGTTHTQGLRLGSPIESRRGVEIFWHRGSNDNRISLVLSVPNGADVFEFHRNFDAVLREKNDPQPKVAPVKTTTNGVLAKPAIPAKPVITSSVTLTNERIFHVMQELHNAAPVLGFINRDECIDLIGALEEEARIVFDLLMSEGHLLPLEGSETMVQLSNTWKRTFQPTPGPSTTEDIGEQVKKVKVAEVVTPTPNQKEPTTAPFQHSGIFAPRLDYATEIAALVAKDEQAKALENTLVSIEGEIGEIEITIAPQIKRLEVLRAQKKQITEALESTELVQARGILSALAKMLDKSS